MSTSILSVIDENNNVVIDPNVADDPIAQALQPLRILKTTTNSNLTPTTVGRDIGRAISFNNVTYHDYQMRRKAEILKYNKNKNDRTKKSQFSSSSTGNTNYKRTSNARIKELIANNQCQNQIEFLNTGSASGIKGDQSVLYLDPNIPYYEKI